MFVVAIEMVSLGGKIYSPKQEFELEDALAEDLMQRGMVVALTDEVDSKTDSDAEAVEVEGTSKKTTKKK